MSVPLNSIEEELKVVRLKVVLISLWPAIRGLKERSLQESPFTYKFGMFVMEFK